MDIKDISNIMNDWSSQATDELLYLRGEVQRLRGIEKQYKGLLAELRHRLPPGSNLTSIKCPNGKAVILNDEKVEVKFSSNNSKRTGHVKWDWNHIVGTHNTKQFERLVLIGAFDGGYKCFSMRYKDIPPALIAPFKSGCRITIRYSEKEWSKYSRLLKQSECTLPDK